MAESTTLSAKTLTRRNAKDKTVLAILPLGIAAPQDVSVVGVDNMAYLCESTSPTLSSILMDHSGEGRAAAQLLDGLMEAPNRKTPPPRAVPPLRVVRRASSRAASDRRVAKAIEFIRLGACEEGFSPRDVVANMGVSRSLAFDLFRRVAGHTILDEILHVRLDKAFTLLADTDTAIGAIYAHCGFRSPRALDFLVHDRTGMSMREWRRRNARK